MSQNERRLQDLLFSLRAYQGELEDATREGLDFIAERAREEIRKREAMIRRHCRATGLAVPAEVPCVNNTRAKLRELLDKVTGYRSSSIAR